MIHNILLCILLLGFSSVADACLACGVCSTGMCNAPPPPPPTCGGCSRGYACGSYGCYRMRARARSSLTLKIDETQKEELSRLSPDEKFQKCCEDRNLPDGCMSKCSYAGYNRDVLQRMYLHLDACPLQAAADIHFCAAQGGDHTDCCYRNGVSTTLAGPKCLLFCDQRPGNVTQLDISYLACYTRFDSMRSCFYDYVATGEGSRVPPVSIPGPSAEEPEPQGGEGHPEFGDSMDETVIDRQQQARQPFARTFAKTFAG